MKKIDKFEQPIAKNFLNKIKEEIEKAQLICVKIVRREEVSKKDLEFISKKYPDMKQMAEESLKGERGIAKLKEIPIGRFTEPEDVANVVLFLAAEESSAVNGHVLVVDGGTLCIQSPTRASQINIDSLKTSYRQ